MTPGAPAHGPLPPIRVLPIPENRPPALSADVPMVTLAVQGHRPAPYIQDALAFDLLPRRTDSDRFVAPVDLPDPQEWVSRISQALIEIMAGLRPPSHAVRSCSPEVYLAVSRRYASAARRAGGAGPGRIRRPSVARVHVSRPGDRVLEAVALLVLGPRVRAMALRAEVTQTGWRVTALELG